MKTTQNKTETPDQAAGKVCSAMCCEGQCSESGVTSFGCAGQDPRAQHGPADLIPAGDTNAVILQGTQLLDLIHRWRSRGVKDDDGAFTQRISFLDLSKEWTRGPG